jgi:hypothetical protein
MQQKTRISLESSTVRAQIVQESTQLVLDFLSTRAVGFQHKPKEAVPPDLSLKRVLSLLTSVKTLSLSARSKKEEALQKVISKIREAQVDYAQTGAKKTNWNKK